MQVILVKDLKRKGTFGDIIEVADGYARNYLIPNGYALVANTANKKRFAEIETKELEKVTSLRKELTSTADQIKGKTFSQVCLSRDGKLYGSVTASTISDLIKEELPDVKINGSDILIEDGNIKFVGTYACKVQFTKEIFSNFTVIIEADESDEQPELLESILEEEDASAPDDDETVSEDASASDDDETVAEDASASDDDETIAEEASASDDDEIVAEEASASDDDEIVAEDANSETVSS